MSRLFAAAAALAVSPVSAAAQHHHEHPTPPVPAASPASPAPTQAPHTQHHAGAPATQAPTDGTAPSGRHAHMAADPTMGMGDIYFSGSGTARLPLADAPMRGAMIHSGEWMLMAHGFAWGVATDQGGPRGEDKLFVTTMAMLMADRDLSDRVHLQLKAMGSLDPLMGRRGYPNLFATGETAFGQPLVDRQHPHDVAMELAARLDYRVGDGRLFVYGGPVGEPALGVPAFMMRPSARYLPLAPITHHWFDSTHITYGVVTAGYAGPKGQLEASAFRGREPDERRWNIERPQLDSWSVRATWAPTPNLLAQVSHARLEQPEPQHPGEDQHRTTASLHYAGGGLSAMLAWSRKDEIGGPAREAWLGEASWEIGPHALFGRVEHVENDELFPDHDDPLHDRPFRVTKAEAGYAYRLRLAGPLGVALGGTVAAYAKPAALDAVYGERPVSWTLFSKLVLGL